MRSYSNKDKFQIYRSLETNLRRNLHFNNNGQLCHRWAELCQDGMRSEEGDWRRQDATEVWYFAEKSSHCLKVDGVTPKEEDNIWCCLHQQPTPPRPFAQPPLSAKWRKLVFNYSCTHPPFHLSSSLVLSYTAFRVATIRFIRPYPLLRISLELSTSFFAIPSVTQSWWTTSLWNYEK